MCVLFGICYRELIIKFVTTNSDINKILEAQDLQHIYMYIYVYQ